MPPWVAASPAAALAALPRGLALCPHAEGELGRPPELARREGPPLNTSKVGSCHRLFFNIVVQSFSGFMIFEIVSKFSSSDVCSKGAASDLQFWGLPDGGMSRGRLLWLTGGPDKGRT